MKGVSQRFHCIMKGVLQRIYCEGCIVKDVS